MYKLKTLVAGALLCYASTGTASEFGSANYASHWNLGFDVGRFSTEYDTSPNIYVARIGYDLTNVLALETHLFYTEESDKATTEKYSAYGASLFARANLRLGRANLYGLAGYSYVKAKYSIDIISFEDTGSTSGLAYGLGLDLYGSQDTAIGISWTNYLHKSGYNADTIRLGFTHYFDFPSVTHRY